MLQHDNHSESLQILRNFELHLSVMSWCSDDVAILQHHHLPAAAAVPAAGPATHNTPHFIIPPKVKNQSCNSLLIYCIHHVHNITSWVLIELQVFANTCKKAEISSKLKRISRNTKRPVHNNCFQNLTLINTTSMDPTITQISGLYI